MNQRESPEDVTAEAPSVQRRRRDHAAVYARLGSLRELVSSAPVPEIPMTILPGEQPAQSAGEAALQLVIEAFARREQGKLFKVDPVIHFSLQSLNAYRVWKIDPQAVIHWFPRVYELLRRIHESMPAAPPRRE
jgi:hypothetical protein